MKLETLEYGCWAGDETAMNALHRISESAPTTTRLTIFTKDTCPRPDQKCVFLYSTNGIFQGACTYQLGTRFYLDDLEEVPSITGVIKIFALDASRANEISEPNDSAFRKELERLHQNQLKWRGIPNPPRKARSYFAQP